MEMIQVKYKEIQGSHGVFYHKYIVYKDINGDTWFARGGPSTGSMVPTPAIGFGYVYTQTGTYDRDSIDWDDNKVDQIETIVTGSDLSSSWQSILNTMATINDAKYAYKPFGQNSNTTVDYALNQAGLPPTQLDDDLTSPGAPSFMDYYDPNLPGSISEWMENTLDALAVATGLASPLIIDLNKNGVIDLISLSNSTALFDVDGDGFAEHTGWVGSTDGFLVYDRNEDGIINNISELFGSVQEEGFAHLALLDSNADGVIDANDEKWTSLQVWVDANGNGFSEETELHTLDYFDIASISLTNVRVDLTVNGNIITNEGTITYNDTSTGKIVDAWFAYDDANTVYSQPYTLDIRTIFLPSLRGYGNLGDLHIAMSIDNETGGLLEMVQSVAIQDAATLFDSNIVSDIRDILYRWADVDGLSPTSRGPNVDARSLAFLEKLSGEPFLQLGYEDIPRVQAGKMLTRTFDDALNEIMMRVVLQSAGNELFGNGVTYDIATDSFGTFGALNTNFLDDLSDAAALSSDKASFWGNVLQVVVTARGGLSSNITTADMNALDAAIYNSDNALNYAIVHDSLFADVTQGITVNGDGNDNTINGTVKNDNLRGYGGNDTINGDIGDDVLRGDGGNDILNGGPGADILYGDDGNDVLTGGQGEDLLFGGYGNDTFIYNLGDGYDTIRESGNTELNDKIVFGVGISIANLTFTRLSNNDLSIQINVIGYEGEIVIENQFNTLSTAGSVETLEFSDASTFDLTSLNFTLTGSDSSETLHGATVASGGVDTIYGGRGNDRIYGYHGSDIISGGDGDDTIYGGGENYIHYSEMDTNYLHGDDGNDYIFGSYGVDHIYGGTGNDTLLGNRGNDEYYFNLNDGHDTITEVDASGFGTTDTLNLGAGITTDDVTIIRESSYNLKILINGGQGGSVTLIDQFKTLSGSGAVEYIKFHDTTIWDLTTMSFGLVATDSSETLHGNNSNVGSPDDIIYAEGGNDTIYGYLGSDQLHGGDGNDIIHAGTGSITYYGKTTTNYLYGDAGNDTIWGAYGVDHIYGGTGNDILNGRLGNDRYYFSRGHGNDTIQEQGKVVGSDNIDTLHLGEGISEGDLSYVRDGNYNLAVLINGGAGGSINIINQFLTSSAGAAIEYILLSDNTHIDLRNMNYTLIGTSNGETLHGTEENSLKDDIIYGEGGNDTIYGYLGSDTLYGGDGNDTIHAGTGSITYYGKTTTNYLHGDAGNDTIYGAYGVDHIYGGTGNDTLRGRLGSDQYYYAAGDGDDTIIEEGKTDIDVLNFDSSIEEGDLSYIRVGNTDLKIMINGGADGSILLSGQFSTYSGDAAVEIIKLHDDTEIDLRTLNYTLTGTSGNDTLNGTLVNSGGVDTIYGGAGNDTISGYGGSDILYGGDGNDIIHGGGSSSTYYAETESNWLYGEAGTDTLYGSNGDDFLYGGDGSDTLTGRAGADTFIFLNGETGIDIITDFNIGQGDKIDISNLLFGFDPLTDSITDFVEFTTSGSNTIIKIDQDGTGGSYGWSQIATLSNVTGLTDETALATSGNLIVS